MEIKLKYNLNYTVLLQGTYENILYKATDIGNILNVKAIPTYMKKYDESEKILIINNKKKITFFTEKGLYKFLERNKKKEFIVFKNWIKDTIDELKEMKHNFNIEKHNYEIKFDEIICDECEEQTKCIVTNCGKKASYNIKGTKKVLYCKKHSTKDMIYINENVYCIEENCLKLACCNYPMEKIYLYCSDHKKENMENIYSKKCIGENCNLIPYFNFVGLSPKYCKKHSDEGMINVKDKRCEKENCQELARYNLKNDSSLKYCLLHREPGMIDKKGDYCIFENCNTLASYNYQGQTKKLYCSTHYLPGMINVKHRKCLTENCNTIVNNDRYKGYCLYCFMHIFPLEKVSRNYRTKEKAVSDFIETAFPQHKFVINRKIYGGISKNRPDALLDKDTHILIIEIDENQHENYDCNCEMNRIGQILEDLKYKTTVFIRFNPDKYYDINNNLIPSPWIANKQGILNIPNENKNEWQNRLNILKDTIDYWNNNITDNIIEIVQLFYDQI